MSCAFFDERAGGVERVRGLADSVAASFRDSRAAIRAIAWSTAALPAAMSATKRYYR